MVPWRRKRIQISPFNLVTGSGSGLLDHSVHSTWQVTNLVSARDKPYPDRINLHAFLLSTSILDMVFPPISRCPHVDQFIEMIKPPPSTSFMLSSRPKYESDSPDYPFTSIKPVKVYPTFNRLIFSHSPRHLQSTSKQVYPYSQTRNAPQNQGPTPTVKSRLDNFQSKLHRSAHHVVASGDRYYMFQMAGSYGQCVRAHDLIVPPPLDLQVCRILNIQKE